MTVKNVSMFIVSISILMENETEKCTLKSVMII